MAPSCKLSFARFSARLKFQDRAECGNITIYHRHSLLQQLLLSLIVSFVLYANLLASVIQPNLLGGCQRSASISFQRRASSLQVIPMPRETHLWSSHHPPPSRSWRRSRLGPSGTLESTPTLCILLNKVEVRLLSWWQLMRTLKSPFQSAYQKTSAED